MAMKKVEKIRQIVRLKQIMMRWKLASLRLRLRPALSYDDDSDSSSSSGSSTRRTPAGFLAVYVGPERRRFVIPARFVNLPVFVGLLDKAAEEFGFETTGGLVLPCEVAFFKDILKFLEKDERKFGKLALDEFLKMVTDAVGFDSCKAAAAASSGAGSSFTPLLQDARIDIGYQRCTWMGSALILLLLWPELRAGEWDTGGMYQLGMFPHWAIWSEWNGRLSTLKGHIFWPSGVHADLAEFEMTANKPEAKVSKDQCQVYF